MGRLGTFLGLIATVTLAGVSSASAATATTPVVGSMSPTQETCLQGLTTSVGDGENCMYDEGPSSVATAIPFGELTGPYNHITYYDSVDTPAAFQTTLTGSARTLYAPTVGDGKMSQDITGSVTIDDGGDGFGAGDLISFSLSLTSSGPGAIVRHYGTSVVDKYDSMTQTLAPTAATSATANGSGGFDYVIGSEGFPGPLTFAGTLGNDTGECVGAAFGFVECGHSFGTPSVEPDFWNGVTTAGIGSLESNFGAKTTGSVTNLQCLDSRSSGGIESNDCRDSQVSYSPWITGPCAAPGGCILKEGDVGAVRGAAEDASWDQLLLKVSTDAAGSVIAVEGFSVDDYRVFGVTRCGDNTTGSGSYGATCNSWTTGRFTLAPATAGQAGDDGPYFAVPGFQLDIPVLANDTNFNDPVTVTVTTPAAQGVTAVSGSPGPAAALRISYTANVGATGNDSFAYQATDGVSTDTATVSIVIGPGANDDIASTSRNQPVAIAVGANDPGFDNSVSVTINNDFSNGGSATVTAGDGGPASGIVVTYTPVSAIGAPAYEETFTYIIDDGVLPPAQATVTVSVANGVPQNLDGNLAVSTAGVDPDGVEATFTLPPGGGSLGDAPVTIAITADPARGTATVSGNSIIYTVTDPTFFVGSDSFSYSVTDADGDSGSGVVSVTATDAAPVLAESFIVVGQGRTSSPLAPTITAGNGAPESHTLAITGQGTEGSCAVSPGDGTGEITYTPDDSGFLGEDACELTLTDADGDSVSAPVSIRVVERGAVGGASSLGPWSLLLLTGLALLRRARGQRRRGAALGVAATLALAAAGTTVSAQEAADETDVDDLAIEEIVVTARKVEEKLLEVPLAITAFDANMIEQKGISNLADVATLTPGLSFFNAFGENLPVPVIRGVVPTDIFGQNNAAVFVDGVYIAGREGLNSALLETERVEVVKGPQSALYGRNAFSGAINYVTKLPGEVFEAKTGVEMGNRGKVKGTASVSGPILGENFRGRISAMYDEWDGSYDNPVAPTDVGGYRNRVLMAGLYWLPAEDWTVNFSYYYANDDIDESATVSFPTNCEDRVGDNNATPRLQNFCGEVPDIEAAPGLNGEDAIPKVAQATGENRELDRASLRIEWDLHEFGTLASLTGYSNTRQSSVSDFARSLGYSQPFLYCDNAAPEDPEVPNSCLTNPATERFLSGVYDHENGGETEEFSQELRFSSSQDQRWRYTVGGYWYKTNSQAYPGGPIATATLPQASTPGSAIGLPPFDPSAPNFAIGTAIFYTTFTPDGGIDPQGRRLSDNDTEGWAVFGGSDFDLTDTLTARAELRLSQESQQQTSFRYAECPDKTASVPLCGDDVYDLRIGAPTAFINADDQCIIDGVLRSLGECSRYGTARFEQVTGRIGLDWQFSDDWMVYGSVAYGEKPGGLQLIGVQVILPAGGLENRVITSTFEPEELTAYELGLKGTTWDGRMTISTAVFYNDWKEIVLRQLRETDPVSGLPLEQPTAFNVNAGDAGVLGFEMELNAALADGLTGRFTLGWADAEIDNAAQDTFELFPTFAPDGDVSGNQLLRQPEWLISGSLSYERQLAGDWDWYASGDANYQSGVYVGNENQGYLPEHTYVNTKLGVRSGQYTVELWGRNIFDDNNAVAAFRDIYWANSDDLYAPYRNDSGPRPNFDDFVPLRYTVTYPRERTYGVTFLMRFGGAVR